MAPPRTRGYRLGPVEIDLVAKCIRREGVEEYTRPTTFEVLVMLIEQRHRPVGKQELIDTLWKGTTVSDDVLVQRIVEIRKLLEDDARNPRYIKTLSKVGYRFIGQVDEIGFEQPARDTPTVIATDSVLAVPKPRPAWRFAVLAVILLTAAALALLLGARLSPAPSAERPSVAVLPFANLTGNPDYEYLSDGLTDEMASALMATGRVRVVARSSSFRFRDTPDVRSVGHQLGADVIVEGSLRKSADRMRIIVQLSRSSDGFGLWSKTYDQSGQDFSSAAGRLATDIAAELKVKLPAGSPNRRVVSSEAHELYLLGRYRYKRSRQGLHASVELFEKAIALEPGYALAYAGLADSYTVMLDNGEPGAREFAARAKSAAAKAIELDPSLADPHAALGLVLADWDWDWKGSEAEFRKAIALNPDLSAAHQWFGSCLRYQRRFSEAMQEVEAAKRCDPLSMAVRVNIGDVYFATGDYDAALSAFRNVLELEPEWRRAHTQVGLTLTQKGVYNEAVTELKLGRGLKNDEPAPIDALAYLYAVSGRISEARTLVQQIESDTATLGQRPFEFAGMHAMIGDRDRAFQLLDEGLEARSGVTGLQIDTRWFKLHDDPRYQKAVKRIFGSASN